MVAFKYDAKDALGKTVQGVVEAQDRRLALKELERSGYFPLSLNPCDEPSKEIAKEAPKPKEAATKEAPKEKIQKKSSEGTQASDVRSKGRIKRKEVTAFTRELATLLSASIPIPQALEGLGDQEENEALSFLIHDLLSGVRRGETYSEALSRHPRQFPTLYTSMVRVGEESGQLAQVLSDLADLMEGEDEIRSEVMGAVAYPAFVLGMGVITTIVLMTVVLPQIFEMFVGMEDVLPLPTKLLMQFSNFLQTQWISISVVTLAVIFGFRTFIKSPTGSILWDAWKLRLPLLGPVFSASALGRFTRTLGTLTRSGVSLLPALEIVRGTVGNSKVAEGIATVTEDTRGGDSLANPLKRLELFPPTMVQMISVGEETGQLDSMLLRVADIQERHLRRRTNTLISLLAPVLILVVGALVGFIVIALLLPIFKMSQLVG